VLIPESFRLAYAQQVAVINNVKPRAESRLRVLCENNGWLFDHRVKGPESVLAKLQLGKISAIGEMSDFYATMVVVPTLREIEAAVAAVTAAFHDVERKPPRSLEAEELIYDDTHLLVSLGPLGPLDPTGLISKRRIEVQVRTGLQYAWWRATHDDIYKGADDWRLRRLAAQLRGSLEQIDGVLENMAAAAALIHSPPGLQPDTEAAVISSWQSRWVEEARVEDPRRFVDTVRTYAAAAGIAISGVEAALDSAAGQTHVANADVTPAQAVLLAIIDAHGSQVLMGLRAAGRQVLVTKEMEAASGVLLRLSQQDRVALISS
jgi:ppGpp synthetase/RelA/SpoT-type nucleotidyltranferase